jgi:hypothetical protein
MRAQGKLRHRLLPPLAIAAALAAAAGSRAQTPESTPRAVRPASSVEQPADVGRRMHTNVEIVVPSGSSGPTNAPPVSGYLIETPASLACSYQLVAGISTGCNPNRVTANPTGGSRAIAIVDAYDYPTAASDLNAFIAQFGLARANLTVIYGTGSPSNGCVNGPQPPSGAGTGWDLEAALDIEWAHAMAPGAQLYLVEANSNSDADMFNAEQIATACVEGAGGGEVSNSWGGSEFRGELAYDSLFDNAGVVYFAASGDTPGVEYPSSSPHVIAVGGTTFSQNQRTGAYQSQLVWNDIARGWGTGGGFSAYETRPAFQNAIKTIVDGARGVPDLSGFADPYVGVYVYNCTYSGACAWWQLGGTSVATPTNAGIVNAFGLFWGSSSAALSDIYPFGRVHAFAARPAAKAGAILPILPILPVTDIISGACGPGHLTYASNGGGYDPAYILSTTGIAWSPCDGWGTPHGDHTR